MTSTIHREAAASTAATLTAEEVGRLEAFRALAEELPDRLRPRNHSARIRLLARMRREGVRVVYYGRSAMVLRAEWEAALPSLLRPRQGGGRRRLAAVGGGA